MKKSSQISDQGLLKKQKAYFIGEILTLTTSIAGLGLILASIGMDIYDTNTTAEMLTTAGVGAGIGLISGIASQIFNKLDAKVTTEKTIQNSTEKPSLTMEELNMGE